MRKEDVIEIIERHKQQMDELESSIQQSLEQTSYYTNKLLELRAKIVLEISQQIINEEK